MLLPASELRGARLFRVERERDGLEPLEYTDMKKIHDDYQNDVVSAPAMHASFLFHMFAIADT